MSELTNRVTTFSDLVEHARDYLGVSVTADAARDARRAITNAYRSVGSMRNWSYYYKRGRLTTNASYDTGTVVFTYSGGLYERMLTITTGTWPVWAKFGTVRISSIDYEVEDRKSNTVITLKEESNPFADVASTTYEIFRDTYPMPVDFQRADDMLLGSNLLGILEYVHPSEWLESRTNIGSSSQPSRYTFMADPNYIGVMALALDPQPNQDYGIDFIYKRMPRNLLVVEEKTGTISIADGNDVVTGTGTAFKDNHVGSIMRFSEVANKYPTGITGGNPFEIQRTIVGVTSATELVIDESIPQTFTNMRYTISDPVDVEDGAMMNFLLREIEKQLRIARRMKPAPEEEMEYSKAQLRACEADSRSFARRGVMTRRLVEWWKGTATDVGV